jgi:glutathione synthase
MEKYNILILTDHTNHSKENSVYALANAFRDHQYTNRLDIATRGIPENDVVFKKLTDNKIWVTEVQKDFHFTENGALFKQALQQVAINDYDLILLRLPPPLSEPFLNFLEKYPECIIINSPSAIKETGSKEFLMKFQHICPPMKICKSVDDIIEFKNRFPIVLKPFREYCGKGIIRIDGEDVWVGENQLTFDEFISTLNKDEIQYLGVKYLKNVNKGDKRIVVVNGKVLGASLRLPKKRFLVM